MAVIEELYALLGFKVEGEEAVEKFDRGLKKASGTLSTFQAGLAGFAGGLAAGFATQITRAAGQIATALNPLSAAGDIAPILDNLVKFADRTGVAFDALQELQFAAGQSGASVGEFQSGIQNISKNLAEAARGTGRAKKALEDYGLSAKDAGGNVKSADTFLMELADKFQTLDEGQQLDLASKLGISPAMVTMLKSGNVEIEKLRQQARDAGLIFTEEDARNAEKYNDAMTLFTLSIRTLRHAIGVEALPAMLQFIGRMQLWFNTNREFLRQNISDVFRRIGFSLRTLSGILSGINVGHLQAIGIAFGLWAAWAFPLIRNLAFIGFAIEDLLHYIGGGDSTFGAFVKWLQDTLGVSEGVAETMAGVAAALLAITVLKPRALIWLVGALWGLSGATAALKALGATALFTGMATGMTTLGAAALALAWKVALGVAALWGLHTIAKKWAEGPFKPETPLDEIMQTDKAKDWAQRLRSAVGLGSDAGPSIGSSVGANIGAMAGGAVQPGNTSNSVSVGDINITVPTSDPQAIGNAVKSAIEGVDVKSMFINGATVVTP